MVDGTLLHYLVIHKTTKKQVVIADPGKGLRKITPEDFFKEWTSVLIFIVPSNEFKKVSETKGLFARFIEFLVPQKRLF